MRRALGLAAKVSNVSSGASAGAQRWALTLCHVQSPSGRHAVFAVHWEGLESCQTTPAVNATSSVIESESEMSESLRRLCTACKARNM